MYPDSPYAIPIGSFRSPVPLPTTDANAGDLVYIGINCEWLPYIIGALKQLLLQATWDTTDPMALNLVQQRVFTLMSLFDCQHAPTLADLCGLQGSGEDDMCCCIRVQDGVLQTLVCGTWTDVPGQPPGGFFTPSQPGAGTPQPAAGGGCQTYHGNMGAQGPWYLPTLVSDGDTLQVSNFAGAWNGGDLSRWYCGDGQRFVAGACIGLAAHDSGDPLPTAFHMALIGQIGSTFIDLSSGLVTLSGIGTNQQMTLLPNDAALSDNSGDVSFDIEVCNNQPPSWCNTRNFALSPGDWVPYADAVQPGAGVWTVGQGMASNNATGSNGHGYQGTGAELTFSSKHIKSIDIEFDLTKGTCDNPTDKGILIVVNTTIEQFVLYSGMTTGAGQHFRWDGDVVAATFIAIYVGASDQNSGAFDLGSSLLKSITICGVGPELVP